MGRLTGKVALVTGSTRGLGEATARALAGEDAAVAITGRNAEDGHRVVEAIRAAGGTAEYLPLDLNDEASVKRAMEGAAARFGGLHVLVNNGAPTEYITGSTGNKIDDFITELSTENWRKIVVPCIDGLFWSLKYAIPQIQKSGGGSIVNISSIASIRGIAGVDAATASKGAMNALTLSVARAYAPRIRCNALLAGPFATPGFAQMLANPAIRKAFNDTVLTEEIGVPQNLANTVVFFASDESAYVTGQLLPVDGGITIAVPVPKLETGVA